MSDVVRIDSLISFHLSKLSNAKFSILYDISLVRHWKRKLKLITLGSGTVNTIYSSRMFVESVSRGIVSCERVGMSPNNRMLVGLCWWFTFSPMTRDRSSTIAFCPWKAWSWLFMYSATLFWNKQTNKQTNKQIRCLVVQCDRPGESCLQRDCW